MPVASWFLTRPSRARTQLRLYCFSYAGGSAAVFAPWHDLIDPGIEICAVQLPGRADRIAEPLCLSIAQAVEAIAQETQRPDGLPYAFFGHSLGGLLAFEVARFCARHYFTLPKHLIVSGCGAPQLRSASRSLHELPDSQFIDLLHQYDGTPREILQNEELMGLLLPAIRADFGMVANYEYRHSPRLKVPITVLAGLQDSHVSPAQAEGWCRETESGCHLEWLEGGHFFIHSQREEIIRSVNRILAG